MSASNLESFGSSTDPVVPDETFAHLLRPYEHSNYSLEAHDSYISFPSMPESIPEVIPSENIENMSLSSAEHIPRPYDQSPHEKFDTWKCSACNTINNPDPNMPPSTPTDRYLFNIPPSPPFLKLRTDVERSIDPFVRAVSPFFVPRNYTESDFFLERPNIDQELYLEMKRLSERNVALLKSYWSRYLPKEGYIVDFCTVPGGSYFPVGHSQYTIMKENKRQLQLLAMGPNVEPGWYRPDDKNRLDEGWREAWTWNCDVNVDHQSIFMSRCIHSYFLHGGTVGLQDIDIITSLGSMQCITKPIGVLSGLYLMASIGCTIHIVVNSMKPEWLPWCTKVWRECGTINNTLLLVADFLQQSGWEDIQVVWWTTREYQKEMEQIDRQFGGVDDITKYSILLVRARRNRSAERVAIATKAYNVPEDPYFVGPLE